MVHAGLVGLEGAHASWNAPHVVHLVLGTAGLGTKEHQQAMRHLEQALEQSPEV
jgi:hypothetical protein